jgi:hypothetical protein
MVVYVFVHLMENSMLLRYCIRVSVTNLIIGKIHGREWKNVRKGNWMLL